MGGYVRGDCLVALGFADVVGDEGAPLAAGLVGAFGGVLLCLVFHLGVEFRAEECDVGGEKEPEENDDDGTE